MNEIAFSAPSDRNKQPILELLQLLLPERGRALEIASGTGQHVAWFAAHLPHWQWQPTDADARMLPSIDARVREARLLNVQPARMLDVLQQPWPLGDAQYDLVYCANMLHIAPPACGDALMQGAARHLAPGGMLVTYGPYLEDEVLTTPSNLAFDESLRARHPAWGLRRREDLQELARHAGLDLSERHEMPANNLLLVWRAGREHD
jgi:SAM-dependent methyltransferase